MSVELAERRAQRFPMVTGSIEVLRVTPLTRHMSRITFGGETLTGFPNDEPGEIVTLIWPLDGCELVLPTRGWVFPPEGRDQHARNYTVRAFRPDGDRTELDIDFVIHGDHGQASRWASRARPGDSVGIGGPRLHWVSEPDADWTLLAGDETALPSIAAILETLPAGHPAHVFVEVDAPQDELPLTFACDADVRWVHRGDATAGTGTRLVDAIRAARLPDAPGRAWAAGESLQIRDVRRHLRGELEMPREAVRALGYWRHRETPEDLVEDED